MKHTSTKLILARLYVLYSHKDINNTSNTNTNIGGLCRFRYERVY